jgi:hypothetical protein
LGFPNPETIYMEGSSSSPIYTTLGGGLDLTTEVTGDPTNPVTTLILGDPTKPVTTLLEGDPTKPITTNSTVHMGLNDIRIKELPHIYLSAEMGIKPTRIHNPVDLKFCISFFGLEILSLAMCGESMTIIEPYKPHKTEECC